MSDSQSESDSRSMASSKLSSRASSAEPVVGAGKTLMAAPNLLDEPSSSELSEPPSEDESMNDSLSEEDDKSNEPPAKKQKTGQMTLDTFTKPRTAITIKLSKKSIEAANRLETGNKTKATKKPGDKTTEKKEKKSSGTKSAVKKSGGKKDSEKDGQTNARQKKPSKKSADGETKAKTTSKPKAGTATSKGEKTTKPKDSSKPSAKAKPKKTTNANLNGQTSLIPHDPEDLPWAKEAQLHKDPNVFTQPEGIENSPKLAMVVMFQAQFYSLFRGVPALGPQDLEDGLLSQELSYPVLQLMARLMSLALNRKKPVEPERYGGALEEIRDRLSSLGAGPNWPQNMNLKSKTAVIDLSCKDRLEFLYTLTLWSLTYSESVRSILGDINQKGQAQGGDEEQDVYAEDDLQMKKIMNFKASLEKNQLGKPVQPIGKDDAGLRYFLVKGRGFTPFRIFRQTNPRLREVNWISVASSVEDVHKLIERFSTQQVGPASKLRIYLEDFTLYLGYLAEERVKLERKIEKKRALQQAADLVRAGDGVYVGRTRGRRINYNQDNYASVEEGSSDDYDDHIEDEVRYNRPTRRSARIQEMKSESEPDHDDSVDYADDAMSVDEEEDEDEEDLSKVVVLKYSPAKDMKEHARTQFDGTENETEGLEIKGEESNGWKSPRVSDVEENKLERVEVKAEPTVASNSVAERPQDASVHKVSQVDPVEQKSLTKPEQQSADEVRQLATLEQQVPTEPSPVSNVKGLGSVEEKSLAEPERPSEHPATQVVAAEQKLSTPPERPPVLADSAENKPLVLPSVVPDRQVASEVVDQSNLPIPPAASNNSYQASHTSPSTNSPKLPSLADDSLPSESQALATH